MLTDKEVGKLWRAALESDSGVQIKADVFRDLIRKLVEECANSVKCDFGVCYGDRQTLESTLRRFTIDPKEWPGE